MSPTNVNSRRSGATAAFTLVEVVVSVGLTGIILAGILAGYTFLGRNFARLLNTQGQDEKSRHAVYVFSQDISRAISVSTANSTQLSLLLPAPTPAAPAATASVSYTYTYDTPGKGTLTRTEGTSSIVLLTDLTTLGFKYFNKAGDSITSGPLSVKGVELTFASALGNSTSGTQARYAAVSPRLVLRNKTLLQ